MNNKFILQIFYLFVLKGTHAQCCRNWGYISNPDSLKNAHYKVTFSMKLSITSNNYPRRHGAEELYSLKENAV